MKCIKDVWKWIQQHVLNRFVFIGGIGFFIIYGVVKQYYDQFHQNGLSGSVADWGVFGDYLGGTLGSIFAFLSFVGVLWTIHLTYEERKDQEVEDKKNDIFRVIEVIHRECISILQISRNSNAFDCFESPKQLVNFLKYDDVIVGDKSNHNNWYLFKSDFNDDIKDLLYKLYMLKSLLVEYEKLTKNYYVSDYYKAFYAKYIVKLVAIGIIKDDLVPFYTDLVHGYAKDKTLDVFKDFQPR